MNTFNFVLNNREYTIEKSISGDYCRLKYKGINIFDDSAYEDTYGEPEELVDTFKAIIEGDASKRYPWWVLLDAIIEWGSDPAVIEFEEDAREWSDVLEGAQVWEIEDEEEKEDAAEKLGVDTEEHIFAFVNGNRGNFMLSE